MHAVPVKKPDLRTPSAPPRAAAPSPQLHDVVNRAVDRFLECCQPIDADQRVRGTISELVHPYDQALEALEADIGPSLTAADRPDLLDALFPLICNRLLCNDRPTPDSHIALLHWLLPQAAAFPTDQRSKRLVARLGAAISHRFAASDQDDAGVEFLIDLWRNNQQLGRMNYREFMADVQTLVENCLGVALNRVTELAAVEPGEVRRPYALKIWGLLAKCFGEEISAEVTSVPSVAARFNEHLWKGWKLYSCADLADLRVKLGDYLEIPIEQRAAEEMGLLLDRAAHESAFQDPDGSSADLECAMKLLVLIDPEDTAVQTHIFNSVRRIVANDYGHRIVSEFDPEKKTDLFRIHSARIATAIELLGCVPRSDGAAHLIKDFYNWQRLMVINCPKIFLPLAQAALNFGRSDLAARIVEDRFPESPEDCAVPDLWPKGDRVAKKCIYRVAAIYKAALAAGGNESAVSKELLAILDDSWGQTDLSPAVSKSRAEILSSLIEFRQALLRDADPSGPLEKALTALEFHHMLSRRGEVLIEALTGYKAVLEDHPEDPTTDEEPKVDPLQVALNTVSHDEFILLFPAGLQGVGFALRQRLAKMVVDAADVGGQERELSHEEIEDVSALLTARIERSTARLEFELRYGSKKHQRGLESVVEKLKKDLINRIDSCILESGKASRDLLPTVRGAIKTLREVQRVRQYDPNHIVPLAEFWSECFDHVWTRFEKAQSDESLHAIFLIAGEWSRAIIPEIANCTDSRLNHYRTTLKSVGERVNQALQVVKSNAVADHEDRALVEFHLIALAEFMPRNGGQVTARKSLVGAAQSLARNYESRLDAGVQEENEELIVATLIEGRWTVSALEHAAIASHRLGNAGAARAELYAVGELCGPLMEPLKEYSAKDNDIVALLSEIEEDKNRCVETLKLLQCAAPPGGKISSSINP